MKACEAVHILKMIQGECGKQHMDSEAEALQMGIQALSAQPEIIRCRECVKRKICRTTTIWAVAPDDDWFCADAERREE